MADRRYSQRRGYHQAQRRGFLLAFGDAGADRPYIGLRNSEWKDTRFEWKQSRRGVPRSSLQITKIQSIKAQANSS
jgi:hypothetical protein